MSEIKPAIDGRANATVSREETSLIAAAPPHPLDMKWTLRIDGLQYGPYSGHELKEFVEDGRLEADTDVLRSGAANWVQAGTDVTLKRLFADALPAQAVQTTQSPTNAGDNAHIVQVNQTVHMPAAAVTDAADKSPGVALLLSFLFVGVGQIYNGEIGKGILMFIGCVLLWIILLGWIINIWSMIDAYQVASRKQRAYAATQAQLRPVAA